MANEESVVDPVGQLAEEFMTRYPRVSSRRTAGPGERSANATYCPPFALRPHGGGLRQAGKPDLR